MIDDMTLLDWVEEHKPDIWYRLGFGLWAVSNEGLTDTNAKRYEATTLREALELARADKENWK